MSIQSTNRMPSYSWLLYPKTVILFPATGPKRFPGIGSKDATPITLSDVAQDAEKDKVTGDRRLDNTQRTILSFLSGNTFHRHQVLVTPSKLYRSAAWSSNIGETNYAHIGNAVGKIRTYADPSI